MKLASENPDELRRRVGEMSESDLVDFYWRYEERAADLKDEVFIEHQKPPRTEDAIDDVAQWVVAQGQDYYEEVMLDPRKAPAELPEGQAPPPWTGVAARTYRQRYGRPIRMREDPPPANS
jgi:hypothetical protein